MNFNPNAVFFVIAGAALGYVAGGLDGLSWGIGCTAAFVCLVTAFSR